VEFTQEILHMKAEELLDRLLNLEKLENVRDLIPLLVG